MIQTTPIDTLRMTDTAARKVMVYPCGSPTVKVKWASKYGSTISDGNLGNGFALRIARSSRSVPQDTARGGAHPAVRPCRQGRAGECDQPLRDLWLPQQALAR